MVEFGHLEKLIYFISLKKDFSMKQIFFDTFKKSKTSSMPKKDFKINQKLQN